MPLISPETYTPKAGEPAMMDMAARAMAAEAHYRGLAADGLGRLIALPDDRLWWVPTDMGELAVDLATVLGNPVLGQLMAAALANVADAVEKRVHLTLSNARDTRGITISDPVPTETEDALLGVVQRLEKLHLRTVAALEAMAPAVESRAEKAQAIDAAPPAPKAIINVRESILDELDGLGYSREEGPLNAYTEDGTAYISLHNGVRVGDKQPVVGIATVPAAVSATIAAINQMGVEAGLVHIIWRQYPELQRRNDGFVVRCRLAFGQKKEA